VKRDTKTVLLSQKSPPELLQSLNSFEGTAQNGIDHILSFQHTPAHLSILNSSKLSMSLFYKPGELPYDDNDGPELEAAKAAWWRKG